MSHQLQTVLMTLVVLACSQPQAGEKPIASKKPRAIIAASHSAFHDPRCNQGPHAVSGPHRLPKILEKAEIDFSACKGKYSGNLSLEAEIGLDGRAHNIRLLRPVAPCLDSAATKAFSRTVFCPGSTDGKPVEFTMRFVVYVHYR